MGKKIKITKFDKFSNVLIALVLKALVLEALFHYAYQRVKMLSFSSTTKRCWKTEFSNDKNGGVLNSISLFKYSRK